VAAADRLEFIARFDAERHVAALQARDLGGRGNAHADRRRRGMADVEMRAEALMAGGQKVLDRGQCRSLDHVDHDRGRQDGDASGADERGGMLRPDHQLGGAGEARRDLGEGRADGSGRRHDWDDFLLNASHSHNHDARRCRWS
jgi:hypothetical protein